MYGDPCPNAPTFKYGSLGSSADSNLPPARKYVVYWSGFDGSLYMYGGTDGIATLADMCVRTATLRGISNTAAFASTDVRRC
jgi:hypothetical protein